MAFNSLPHASAQAGKFTAEGERAFNAFIATKNAEVTWTPGNGAAPQNLHLTTAVLIERACAALAETMNSYQNKMVMERETIASRGIWDRGLQWVFPWSTVLFVWMTFFGFYVLYRRRADITVDFVHDRLGRLGQTLVRQLVNLIVLVLMAVMIWRMSAPTMVPA